MLGDFLSPAFHCAFLRPCQICWFLRDWDTSITMFQVDVWHAPQALYYSPAVRNWNLPSRSIPSQRVWLRKDRLGGLFFCHVSRNSMMLGEWDVISFRITIFRALTVIYHYIQPACLKEYMKKRQQGRGQVDSILFFCSLPRLSSWTKGSGTFANQGGTPLACRGSSPQISSIWGVEYGRDSRDWINRQKRNGPISELSAGPGA